MDYYDEPPEVLCERCHQPASVIAQHFGLALCPVCFIEHGGAPEDRPLRKSIAFCEMYGRKSRRLQDILCLSSEDMYDLVKKLHERFPALQSVARRSCQ